MDTAQPNQTGGARRDKAEAFRRLATQRTNAVLEKLRILGNCSNRGLYEYTDEDVRKIFRMIQSELNKTRAKFTGEDRERFEL
jgi:hypothetical protein